MIAALFLVLLDAAVELVGEGVYRGVHVLLGGIGMDRVAAHVQGGFGSLSQLLDCQHAVDINDVIEVSDDSLELFLYVVAEGRGDLDVMTGDAQLHSRLHSSADMKGFT